MAAVADQFMPAMEDPILGDFASSAPDARDAEVLFLYATLVDKLGSRAEAFVPKILQYVFDTTLGMITQDMSQVRAGESGRMGLTRGEVRGEDMAR